MYKFTWAPLCTLVRTSTQNYTIGIWKTMEHKPVNAGPSKKFPEAKYALASQSQLSQIFLI